MTKSIHLLAWVCLLLCSGCSHYYYAPNTLQTPFFQQQHDARISAGLVSSNNVTGFEVHSAYSPVQYGAIMFNYFEARSIRNRSTNFGSPDDWGEGHQLEFALGGYYPTGKYTSFSLFGGWGIGQVLNSYGPKLLADLYFQKRFLQPTFTVQTKLFRLGMALRFNQLEYKRGDINLGISRSELAIIYNLKQASLIFFPETGLSLGLGSKAFWVDVHLNICNSRRLNELHFMPITTSATITLELDKFWRKK